MSKCTVYLIYVILSMTLITGVRGTKYHYRWNG